MHKIIGLIGLVGLLLLTLRGNAQAEPSDNAADLVIGQPDFSSNAQNYGGVSATGLVMPQAAAVDGPGDLFVVDYGNNRVLLFNAPLATGGAASRVFGQPNFSANNQNNGGLGAGSLLLPLGAAVDVGLTGGAPESLYIADSGNRRVLRFDAPLSSDVMADRVFGQPGFTSSLANNGGVSETSLAMPACVAVDGAGTLYVADSANHRVLVFQNPGGANTQAAVSADRVFGQPDFAANLVNNGGVGPGSLNGPQGLALDRWGNLYIADTENHRVLIYTAPITDTLADLVIGQPDFTANSANRGGDPGEGTLNMPFGLAVNLAGTLYVADYGNNRILAFNDPLHSDALADAVFGQAGFSGVNPNAGGLSASSLAGPIRVSLDRSGNLYAADIGNNRVLKYDLPPVFIQLYRLLAPLIRR